MMEAAPLEVCGECLAAVMTGMGPDHLLARLWRKFRGRLVISEDHQLVTFRPCGGCGTDESGVRYGAVHIRPSGSPG